VVTIIKFFKKISNLKKSVKLVDADNLFLLEKCPQCKINIKNAIMSPIGIRTGKRILISHSEVIQELKCTKCNKLVGYSNYKLRK